MSRDSGNGKVTLALLKKDLQYQEKHLEEVKSDIKEIKHILLKGDGKISKNREDIAVVKQDLVTSRRWGTILLTLTSLVIGAISLFAAFR